jgi:FlaA1/EpsC-like NDP-sugar epimerase
MNTSSKLAQKLIRLPRPVKSAAVILVDLCATALALCLAWSLKLDQLVLPGTLPWPQLAIAALSGVAALWSVGFYSAVNRFISRAALLRSGIVTVFSAVVVQACNVFFFDSWTKPSVLIMYAVFMLLHVGGSRLVVRALLTSRKRVRAPVAIYGAGTAGAQLATMLRDAGAYQVVGFLDSNHTLQGRTVEGLTVHAPEYLVQMIEKFHVERVLLAIPNHSRRERRAVLDALEQQGVHVQTVPEIADIVAGNASVADLREVDAGDLLGRQQVAPNVELLHGCIRGKIVMVSGAGGSIGSELCRQIVRLHPVRLILLEMSEAALYQIDRELRSMIAAEQLFVEVVALLGNAHHRYRMREILRSYRIQTIYHAAAYKHVPIVEQNIIEGIHNNVFSTYYIAEAALECRVETFVLISSDKAVNPTNVMGTTKRFAELTLQGMQRRSTRTRFCMVRFGNVLESSGSVVPLFREQIRRGGPVTVTHKDIIRYFMTIPEAAQLVIQAGSMAHGGDVFVLDMAEPIRIEELARRMIRLSGLTVRDTENPEGDIEIVYTGLRPAEKLYEELLIGDNVSSTDHPRIMRATEHSHSWAKMQQLLDDVLIAITEFNCEQAVTLLRDAVVEYRPLDGIQDLVWLQSQDPATRTPSPVTDIRSHRARGRSESDRPQVAF